MRKLRVAREQDIPPGTARTVKAAGRKIALFNVEGRLFATDDACLRGDGSLGQGTLEGSIVTCPVHGQTYDVTTGESSAHDKTLNTYPVDVEDGDVHVTIDA